MLDLTDLRPTPPVPTTDAGERLLAAAADLFYHRGISAAGVDLIAEAAGVTKRTLYQRFGSKDALVAAYLHRRAHVWQTRLLATFDRVDPQTPAAAIGLLFEVAHDWACENVRGCAFINAWAELGHSDHPALEEIRAEKEWMRQFIERVTGDPGAATAVHLLYEGAHVTATTLQNPGAYAEAAVAAQEFVTARDRAENRSTPPKADG